MGYHTVIDVWDFAPGANFVLEMQRAATDADHTLVVLSPACMEALYTQSEWTTAFAQDPTGEQRRLIPIRVQDFEPPAYCAPLFTPTSSTKARQRRLRPY